MNHQEMNVYRFLKNLDLIHNRKNYYIKALLVFFLLIFFPHAVFSQVEESPKLNSEAAILIDAASGQILFEKNSSKRMYPASITKIVTGIIAIEEGQLKDTVTVSENARNIQGTRVYLEVGEEVPLKKLVQGLLISSGNDAGTAIAEYLDQSEDKFAKRMNRFVTDKIGVKNSHFTNPHGLFDENHYTTAYDMAMISKYAMQNETFREIVGTNKLDWVGESWVTTIYNHNRLIRQYEEATGIKNGYVSKSGHTLVGSAKKGNTELIAVTLNAPSSDLMYEDMTELLDYGFDHFESQHYYTKDVFYDAQGTAYKLAKNISFTTKKNETYDINVTDAGKMLVFDAQQQKIYETNLKLQDSVTDQLTKMDQTKRNSKGVHIFEELTAFQKVIRIIFWTLIAFYGIFMLLIAVLLYRKKRLQRLQDRFRYPL